MSGTIRAAVDLERTYEAVDWAIAVLADLPATPKEAREDVLAELIAVRTDLMDDLGMLDERP